MTPEKSAALQSHQQDLFRRIRLPVIGATLFPLGVALLLLLGWGSGNVSAQQVTCVASGMAVIFLFVPLVVMLLLINFLTLWLSFSSPKLTEALQSPLEKAREYSEKGVSITNKTSEKITEPVINLRAKVAYWRTMALGLNEVESDETKK